MFDNDVSLQYLSTQTISNPAASTAIVVPSDAYLAAISIRTAGVHINWMTTATNADTYYAPGLFGIRSPYPLLSTAQVINSSEGAAIVQIDYFKARR